VNQKCSPGEVGGDKMKEQHQVEDRVLYSKREMDKESKLTQLRVLKVIKGIVEKQIKAVRDKRHNLLKQG